MSKDIYTKYTAGDTITDDELEQARKDYKVAEKALFALGPHFEMARKAVTATLVGLNDIYFARKR